MKATMKSHILQLAANVLVLSAMGASAAIRYVNLNSAGPTPPYTNWTTAATTIQDAVDAAVDGDQILVTNGVYQTGGGVVFGTMNRVAVTKPVTVQSVNGAAVTLIQGSHVMRCVYLTNAALLGFTLTNGVAPSGGGALCDSNAVVSNCVLAGNTAVGVQGNWPLGGGATGGTLNNCTLTGNSAIFGGGAFDCTLNNCILTANSAFYDGGGAAGGTLNNCTLTGNGTENRGGGGASQCILNNCIVYDNGFDNGHNYSESLLRYSCTTPLPTNGIGNFTNAPLFVDYAGGNLRLQSNSPCINAGSNAYAPAGPDLDGNPRIAGGTVDVGAYEFQAPQSRISYAWLQQYGLPTDGSADYTDPDRDGMNNWQEWRAGTDPTNALSVLRLLSPAGAASGVAVSWESVSSRKYFLERATNLALQPSFLPLAANLPGRVSTTTFIDTNAIGGGPFFYRVGVQE